MTNELNLIETRAMLLYVSEKMEDSVDALTQADKAIGDGDHGIGMGRGFAAVRQKLDGASFNTLDELLKAAGMALVTSVGGAAGVIFGTLFRGGAKNLTGKTSFDSAALAAMLSDGLAAIEERGKAKPGDKTMIDALDPAATKAQALTALPLSEALPQVTEAAREGMEASKNMIATMGRAKTLGERALGHPDPGAVSTYFILKFMTEYIATK